MSASDQSRAVSPPALLNLPNLLTALRLALVPVFFAAMMANGGHDPDWRFVAFGVFVLASITDRLDGDIARRRGLVTALGTIADPIADKALVGAALIGLSVLGELPWWVTVVVLVREIGITGLRFWVIRHGIIPASRGGKAKAFSQAVAIGCYVLPLEVLITVPLVVDGVRWSLMATVLVLTVVTGVDYVVGALRRRAAAAAAKLAPTGPNAAAGPTAVPEVP